jgi:hypothetical protein
MPPNGCQAPDSQDLSSFGAAANRVLRAAAQSAARFRRNPSEHSLTCWSLFGTAGAGGDACAMHLEGGILVPSAVTVAASRRRGRPAAV